MSKYITIQVITNMSFKCSQIRQLTFHDSSGSMCIDTSLNKKVLKMNTFVKEGVLTTKINSRKKTGQPEEHFFRPKLAVSVVSR